MFGSSKIIAAAATLILAGAVLAIVWQVWPRSSPPLPAHDWFYDLNSGQLFAGPIGAIPPIDAPSGPQPDGTPAGVRARVYSCHHCSPADRTIAWLETYTVEHRDILRGPQNLPKTPAEDKPYIPGPEHLELMAGGGLLVKRPGDKEWIAHNTAEGRSLTVVPGCPTGQAPEECRP